MLREKRFNKIMCIKNPNWVGGVGCKLQTYKWLTEEIAISVTIKK